MKNFQTDLISMSTWTTRAQKHIEKISPWTEAFLQRRALGKSHPVHDFLFTYYGTSPQKLKQWVPSFEDHLEIDTKALEEYHWLNGYWFSIANNTLSANQERILSKTRELAGFAAALCENILKRAPRYQCFGLHEWAMVYKSSPEEIRHKGHRLRLASNDLAAFVESQTICCSHYDAYRFFTKEAQPLNLLKPTIETRLQMEQGGCLHANMDIYKWASKLWPWVGSDFIAKAFFLALQGRELDMRASPYDLIHEGYAPICIETEAGREQYQLEQQQLTEFSIPLRKELQMICSRLSACPESL